MRGLRRPEYAASPSATEPDGGATTGRIAALDLIRGIAVLGILAVNIAGFAGPIGATLTPHVPLAATAGDEAAFAFSFVVFEGKMRALFTMLFGASMLLFIDRAEQAGRAGAALQARRLGWLLLFGMLHYVLLWWGDILFVFAAIGFLALSFRHAEPKALAAAALLLFAGWHGFGAISDQPPVTIEEQVRLGAARPALMAEQAGYLREMRQTATAEIARYRAPFLVQVRDKILHHPGWQLNMTLFSFGETFPLMLIGMALYRSGLFSGRWPRRHLWQLAGGGLALGLIPTLLVLGWVWPRDFPPQAMRVAINYWLALPHLATALAYAALLMLAAPRLLQTRLGKRIEAAGRMAFSNYIATTVVMTTIFYGWGLGLIGTVGAGQQWLFVALGWALMLGWSQPWLARFRQGPLEWLWRSLAEWRRLAFRR